MADKLMCIPKVVKPTNEKTNFDCEYQSYSIKCAPPSIRDKTMADKLMYIPNDGQNYHFCRYIRNYSILVIFSQLIT